MFITILGGFLLLAFAVALAVAVRLKSKAAETYKAKLAAWNEMDSRQQTYRTEPERPDPFGWVTGLIVSGVALLLGVMILGFNSFYTQDVGEAKVLVTWDGKVAGQSIEPGFHLKAPWVSVKTFDVRNNIVSYVGDGTQEYAGNPASGPQVSFQDREGVSGNMDVTVRYALDPTAVSDIYTTYRTQDALVTKVINEAIRGEARKATTTRNTIEVYNDRAGVEADLRTLLEDRIKVEGFIIEEVTIQEVRYSGEVVSRFDEAQAARVAVDRAEAEQEAARVEAETRVIEAQGRADANVAEAEGQSKANDLLTKSLSPEILQQRYIDALKEGTVFVVPEGSNPLVTTTK